MKDRKRLTNLLLSGTLTLLMLTVFLTFRSQATAVTDSVASTTPTSTATDLEPINLATTTDATTLQEQISALQVQNEELSALILLLQEREAEYQAQIEAANETIASLSAPGTTIAMSETGETFIHEGHRHDGSTR